MKTSHITCISKVLIDLCFTKQRIKTKRIKTKVVYSDLVVEVCLRINGAQSVRLEKGTIEFNNYFKQIPVPFKIYADFECNLKSVESYEGSYSKRYQDHLSWVLLTNFFVSMMNLLSQ